MNVRSKQKKESSIGGIYSYRVACSNRDYCHFSKYAASSAGDCTRESTEHMLSQ